MNDDQLHPISTELWKALEFAFSQVGSFDVGEACQWAENNQKDKKQGSKAKLILKQISSDEVRNRVQLTINAALTDLQVPQRPECFFQEMKNLDKTQKTLKLEHAKAIKNLLKDVEGNLTKLNLLTSDIIIITEQNQPVVNIELIEDLGNDKIIFLKNSCHALSSGSYYELDPVTGDASCEMRVPFLLDIVDALKRAGLYNQLININENREIILHTDAIQIIDTVCPFTNFNQGNNTIRRSSSSYLSLCHPLTIIRTQAKDKLGFLIDDHPSKWLFSFKTLESMKSQLATYSVDYMRNLAKSYATKSHKDGVKTMEEMMYDMFQTCNITMGKGGYIQPILPIYTAMRLILMHELRCQRPIVVTITRIGYEEVNGEMRHYHQGSRAYFYRADPNTGKFVPVPKDEITDDEKIMPVTNIHAFNMFKKSGYSMDLMRDIRMEDHAFFYNPGWEQFEAGFLKCDITHLLRLWAAAHPPVPKAARLMLPGDKIYIGDHVINFRQNIGRPGDQGLRTYDPLVMNDLDVDANILIRGYIETCQEVAGGPVNLNYKLPKPSLVCDGIPLFGVTDETMNLLTEYRYYKALALQYDVYEVRYAVDIQTFDFEYILEDDIVTNTDYDKNAQLKKNKKRNKKLARKVFQRQSLDVPFSGVHVFLSSYTLETNNANSLNLTLPKEDDDLWCSPIIDLTLVEEQDPNSNDQNLKTGVTRWEEKQ
ncbi:MAG: hypothetical protein H3C28_01645 [Sphingomonadales bacterium]|nr:hypothetical protein [Sphingomonadales bacterium]